MDRKVAILTFAFMMLLGAVHAAESQEHFYNPPENLNPDPNYVPGDWPFPDPFTARTIYLTKKQALAETISPEDPQTLFNLGLGQLQFSVMKNETSPVAGYFREFLGAVRMGEKGPQAMRMVIDVNSLDTGVPGRNNRILEVFFKSMQPDFGTIELEFNSFNWEGEDWPPMTAGGAHPLAASGTVTLNGQSRPVSASLTVEQKNGTWVVKTAEPVIIRISDFGFEQQAYALMKICNHKALANDVAVTAELYFR